MKDKIKKMMMFSWLAMVAVSLFAEPTEPMKGNSNSEFGEYTISVSDEPLTIKNKEFTTYDLQYNNLDQVVKIGIETNKRCKNFVVKYTNFEVQYVCTKRGFGVKRISPQYKTVNENVVTSLMDETQFNYQEMIVPSEKDTEELLHLIACYFPKLIDAEVRKMTVS